MSTFEIHEQRNGEWYQVGTSLDSEEQAMWKAEKWTKERGNPHKVYKVKTKRIEIVSYEP